MPLVNGHFRRAHLRHGSINYRFGWFFVTFQVAENKSELGAIVGEACVLNELGKRVAALIESLSVYNEEVFVDSFVVMPNHVHLLLRIDDRPTNEEHHLGKIMRKLKSLTAREYRLLKERGLAREIGSKLWQENYWEKIVTRHEQLEAIRGYIAKNPARWSTDRFGPVTSYSRGNLELLNEPFVAFVASQEGRPESLSPKEWERGATPPHPETTHLNSNGATPPHPETAQARGATPPHPETAHLDSSNETTHLNSKNLGGRGCNAPRDREGVERPPVISTFTSPQEREMLRRLIAAKRRFIAVYPGGIPEILPREIAASVEEGRALLLSPVEAGRGVNKQRAVWCNEYVIRRATAVWCGVIKRGGTLESILTGG